MWSQEVGAEAVFDRGVELPGGDLGKDKENIMSRAIVSVVVLVSLTLGAHASSVIVAGNHDLRPDTPNQEITVICTGDDEVQGAAPGPEGRRVLHGYDLCRQ